MAAGSKSGGAGGSLFDEVDATLTIYALANGMDLVKEPGLRRLTWYAAGMERGITLGERPGGGLEVTALAWTENAAKAHRRPVGATLGPEDLAAGLSPRLDEATAAANAL